MINHLFFADDSFLLFWAIEGESEEVKRMLAIYYETWKQGVNFQKSCIHFSKNTNPYQRGKVCSTLRMIEAEKDSFDLGIPMKLGRNKKEVFWVCKAKGG